jgi:diaminopimelate epimerase
MRVPFVKMHGLGNDFVVLDARVDAMPAMTRQLAAALADRHTGIGCDQLILLEPSTSADLRMRIFNHDGGEVEACGNAARAVALLQGKPARIETLGGELMTEPGTTGARIDMGVPRFEWQDIPLAYAMDTYSMPLAWEALENPIAVNVGNPHAIFFVPDCRTVELDRLGPEIEHDPLFPERVNVNVATIETRELIHLRVWERGVGETRACGTGACATAIGAMRRGLAERTVAVRLPGGDLWIEWTAEDRIRMTGPAAESFRGSFESADYGA